MMKYKEIKEGLASKKFSSQEICETYLKRIREVEPKISAFIHHKEDKILQNAKASDERRSNGKELSPYDGIPIGIKDLLPSRTANISAVLGVT